MTSPRPSQEDAQAVLSSCPLFAGADAADIAALAAIAMPVSWPAGSLIFQQGDPGDYMAVITEGRIRLSLTTASGRELTLRHADRGAVIGEMAVLDLQDRSADATATAASRGLIIRRAAFDRLLAERPGVAQTVIRYLSRRLRETTYQLESVALYELSARLARFLLATLRQVHGETLGDTARLTLDLGQSEIAAILGASRPKLNRALASLSEQAAIQRNGRELVCDVAELEAIAAADEI
ncbi:MAG: Crp/Fnr family transcriptional regulator [Alphaproteobacteria bacterium]|nr:Crp/Fnr family transcriptional regulator [Alphaproteobacteria bacterium]